MIKKEILLSPVVKPVDPTGEPPLINTLNRITDLTMDEANQHLSVADKRRWVDESNRTANLYFINNKGYIQKVEPSGWWY